MVSVFWGLEVWVSRLELRVFGLRVRLLVLRFGVFRAFRV